MDFSPIENFLDSAGRTFMVAKLAPTLKTCCFDLMLKNCIELLSS